MGLWATSQGCSLCRHPVGGYKLHQSLQYRLFSGRHLPVADLTHVRTCSRSSRCVQCGALIWPYSSRCSLVVMWSKRTSYCMQTPSSLRTSSVLVCMSLPYTSIEPTDGAKRPVRRDLGTENDYLHHFMIFFSSFPNLLVHFPAGFAVALLQSVITSAKAATFKMEILNSS